MANKERFQAVQSLRFICFLVVFAVHCPFNAIAQINGAWILEIFFMLSGFMMVYSYADRDLPSGIWGSVKYGYKHIGKLYPLHVITTLLQLIMLLIACTFYMKLTGSNNTWMNVLESRLLPLGTHLALLQDWVPDYNIYIFAFNGPSWFLSAMVFCYALFPCIMRLLKKLKTMGNILCVCVGLAVISGIITLIFNVNFGNYEASELTRWVTQNCPAIRCIDFFMGCAMGWFYLEYRRKQREYPDEYPQKTVSAAKWTVIEAMALLLIVVQEYYRLYLGSDNFCQVLISCRAIIPALLTWPVIMVFVLNRGYITKALSWKPLVYLGDISMYTYLIHYVFTQGWANKEFAENWAHVLTVNERIVLSIIELALTIACSIAYDRFMKYRKKRLKEKRDSLAA